MAMPLKTKMEFLMFAAFAKAYMEQNKPLACGIVLFALTFYQMAGASLNLTRAFLPA
jgi:hypothetical protein